jgi:dynein light chain roadblock-type
MSEIEEAINRMKKVKLIITGPEGNVVRSHLESKSSDVGMIIANINDLIDKARNIVRDVDPSNDMTLLRFTLRKHDIIIAPGKNFRIIVIQDTNKDSTAEEKV